MFCCFTNDPVVHGLLCSPIWVCICWHAGGCWGHTNKPGDRVSPRQPRAVLQTDGRYLISGHRPLHVLREPRRKTPHLTPRLFLWNKVNACIERAGLWIRGKSTVANAKIVLLSFLLLLLRFCKTNRVQVVYNLLRSLKYATSTTLKRIRTSCHQKETKRKTKCINEHINETPIQKSTASCKIAKCEWQNQCF